MAGDVTPVLQAPSRFEKKVVRTLSNPNHEPRTQHARTPHHLLNGTITPNGLHFTISHSGIPDIDPDKHRLVIHGLVKQPLEFTLDALARYPMVSRMAFVECGGNSAPMFSNEPMQATVQALHGLVSCAEWTGVLLSTLLEEAGIDPKAKWLLAEGADSLAEPRSVPIKKALDDAMIALYQNGERIMPGNGYPMRLLLPGYEGNMNVKFLRRIKLVDQPAMTYYEAKTYSPILPDGKAYQFYFLQEVKSFITHPSFGHHAEGAGLLRDFRHRLFGHRPHRQGHGLGRRRQELGASGAAGAGAARRRSPASACRGAGTASRSCCKAAPGTRPAMRSRCAPSSWPRAARPRQPVTNPAGVPQPALQQHHQLGRSTAKGRSSMSMRKPLSPLSCWRSLARRGSVAEKRPGSASRSPEADIKAWDITILPDGTNLPPGRARHGRRAPKSMPRNAPPATASGKGGSSDWSATRRSRPASRRPRPSPISGATPRPCSTIIRRAMPWTNPRTLTDDEVYALTAYILALNKIIGENDVMDAQTLPKVKMPNRDNFIIRFPDKI